MDINKLESSELMKKLIDEVQSVLLGKQLHLNMVESIDEEVSQLGAGASAKELSNGDWEISILKDEPDLEHILSHELLHVLLGAKGFPNVYIPESHICCQFSSKIGNLLNNAIHHKLIIDEQHERGFDIKEVPLKKLNDVTYSWQVFPVLSEQTLWNVIALTSFMIEAKICLDEYVAKIASINPMLYQPAKFLYDEINVKPFATPYETRRVMIRLFKKLDELLTANGNTPLQLHKKLLINPIPSRQQLNLKVHQFFDVYNNEKGDLMLTTRAEGQLSFIFYNEHGSTLIEDMRDMTVNDFLQQALNDFFVRE